jgi:perosamine synthetase
MITIAEPAISEKEIEAVAAVMRSKRIVQGRKVEEFESAIAHYCGTKYAVALSSGTTALHVALASLGISAGDEVITTPFTFVSSANAILMQGARVVFADVSEKDSNIDPEKIKEKLTNKTKAIVPVDLYGKMYDYNAISNIVESKDIRIIEDACQAMGASIKGKKAGTFGDCGVFSLYATKNITASEGGILVTDDKEAYEHAKRLRNHGQSDQYEYIELGYNYRMTDIEAAIALVQLSRIDELYEKRKQNALQYNKGLENIDGIKFPVVEPSEVHAFNQYTILITDDFPKSRNELKNALREKGILCGVYYPKPLHMHKHFMSMSYKEGDFPIAEKLSREVLSLPVHPGVTKKDVESVIQAITLYVN